tara:strand:- start:3904 stop:4338 length:435 start_codon:yes stop_codon:yes gene_type:complete
VTAPYTFKRQGRSRATMMLVPAIWLVLLSARFWLNADLLILGLIAVFTLPAVWDVINNPSAGLTLTDSDLCWHSGSRNAQITLAEIDKTRFDTRLDFSVRATVILKNGRKIRIPFEATPPHQDFEHALNAKDIKTERHHFSLRQ